MGIFTMANGPLQGVKVLEFAGLGPAPFCGMLLADMGAEVVRIDRKGGAAQTVVGHSDRSPTGRGKRSVRVDLKNPAGVGACLRLIAGSDILIEGFRPGVMERLGLGPEAALRANPALVYGRMTGWGQDGPNSRHAGHDINYIAISGALSMIGTPERPVPPLNLVGDYGGGALYLAFGVLAALLHARATGVGQVVDAAMSDGAAALLTGIYGSFARGDWSATRGQNMVDGGAPFYGVYQCADGGWISVGALEAQFHAVLLDKLGLADDPQFERRHDRAVWPELRGKLSARFLEKPRAEWCAIFEGTEACVAPVLSLDEAPRHPHNLARKVFVEADGVLQPAPAPRFSATPAAIQGPAPEIGEHDEAVLGGCGFTAAEIAALRVAGALGE
jgi:alpha-methylacyl-CoA racemase